MAVLMGIILILYFIALAINQSGNRVAYFSPFSILVAYSIIDFIIPLVLRPFLGYQSPAVWLAKLDDGRQLSGVVYYVLFYMIMTLFCGWNLKNKKLKQVEINAVNYLRLTVVVVFFWLLKIYFEFTSAGGMSDWFAKKAIMRWTGQAEGETSVPFYLDYVKWDYVLSYMALTYYLYYKDLKRYKILLYLLPTLALAAALMTFFRGALINLLLGYVFIFYIKYKINNGVNSKIRVKKIALMIILVGVAFVFVGGLRTSLEESYKGDAHNNGSLINLLVQGSGLTSITHIVDYYSSTGEYFLGKTYKDMLLLPIPRSIYINKPEWYGVDDITRTMGWPESTQSAVTLPGEAFANFGWLGLIVAPFYGIFLKFIAERINSGHAGWVLWYASLGMGGIGILNWMAFTGLINQILTSIILMLMWRYVRRVR